MLIQKNLFARFMSVPIIFLASILFFNTPRTVQAQELPLSKVAEDLKDFGIKLSLVNWNIYANNVSVGPRQGESSLSTNIAAGMDLDTSKRLGIPGGTFHLKYIFFPANQNVDATASDGGYFGAAGCYYAGTNQSDISSGYLSEFSYEQNLFDDKVAVKVGRFSAGVEFYHKGTLDSILKNDCVEPVYENASGTLPPPYGSWAGMVTVHATDSVYFKAGAFQLDINQYLEEGNGFDWDFDNSVSESYNLEIGYETTYAQKKYPEHYWLTLFRSTYELTSADGSGDTDDGTSGVMLSGRKTVWRADGGASDSPFPEALILFGSLSTLIDPDSVLSFAQRPFQQAAEVGLSYVGPFGRPGDIFSIAFSAAKLSDRYYDFIKEKVPDAEQMTYAIRLRYFASLPHGFFIEPGCAYMINPDDTANAYGYYRSSATQQLDDGWMVRLMFGWNIGQALGL